MPKPGTFVHVKPQTMTQAVYIAILGTRVALDSGMTFRLKQITGPTLELRTVQASFQFVHNLEINRGHVIIDSQNLVRGVTEAPGAGEVVMLTATSFTG